MALSYPRWREQQGRLTDSRINAAQAVANTLPPVLRLLSFNIQAGQAVTAYHHYLTRSWRNILPPSSAGEMHHLDRIGRLLSDFDIVALQEVDAGSIRSGFVHQLERLAASSGLHYHYHQLNRDLGVLGQYGNGLLSRHHPERIDSHALPGLSGRGVVLMHFPLANGETLAVASVHLALSPRGRRQQYRYLAGLAQQSRHCILMGDFNATDDELHGSELMRSGLCAASDQSATWPSWKPRHRLDHILLSPGLEVRSHQVLDIQLSDHCPVAIELALPG